MMCRNVLSLTIAGLFAVNLACGDDDPTDPGSPDAGTPDSGVETGEDAGPTDAEPADAGPADSGIDPAAFSRISCADISGACLQFVPEQRNDLLDAVNDLADDTTLILGAGTFMFDNALTLRGARGITLTGQGMDATNLDFSTQAAQSNGVDVVGDDFTITDLTITDAKKDGLRVEDSTNVIIQRLRVTWSAGPSRDNGSYGIYPVRCINVLIEDSEAFHSADAGIYVGQVMGAVVRRNVARRNVAGIEIENTQFADVYENIAEDNTAGIAIFDLPGNPIFGRDIKIHDNMIRDNNRDNFAPGGSAATTVSQIPAGTGTFILATRRLELYGNTYENNNTVQLAILGGQAAFADPATWTIAIDDLVGNLAGADFEVAEDGVQNYRSNEVWVHDNTFIGGGTDVDDGSALNRPLGFLLGLVYQPDVGTSTAVDDILYDGIGEVVDPSTPANNTNRNRVCLENNGNATAAVLNLSVIQAAAEAFILGNGPAPTLDDIFQPEAPYAPLDCSGFTTGPIADIVLPFLDRVDGPFSRNSCDDVSGNCLSFEAGQENMFLDAINTLNSDTTLILGEGTFSFNNAVTLRQADDITLIGQGIDATVLDFSTQTAQANGVDVISDNFIISDLTITDAKKDGLRVEDSDGVIIRRVKVTWSGGPSTENGAYGIYPVRCQNVLVEDSEAYNASDAGLYVGQVINTIVRRNIAKRNVAGIEIENTQFADVYSNWTEDNTAGLAIFDLPGNPIVGRDVKVHHNAILNNNRNNFALAGTTVSQIPVGTGTFALASRRVEIADNLFLNNDSAALAALSGLAIESSTATWALDRAQLEGSTDGLTLPGDADTVLNFVTNEIWVHDNQLVENGTSADSSMNRPLGFLLRLVYFLPDRTGPVDGILYGGIGEVVDPTTPANNTNQNRICVENNPGATFAVLDLPKLSEMLDMGQFPDTDDIYRPAPPFVPFDCTGLTTGPIPEIELSLSR